MVVDGGEVGGGGGGAEERMGPLIGGRGAAEGGGGGATGGGGADEGGRGADEGGGGAEDGWGGGASDDGLRIPGGGGGFFPTGGGGPFIDAEDIGLGGALGPVFLKDATEGMKAEVVAALCGSGRPDGILGAAPVCGLGAGIPGGLGTETLDVSGSDVYGDSRFAVKLVSLYNRT